MELESIYAKIMQVTEQNFEALALEIFIYQSKNCVIYSQYLKHLQTDVTKVTNLKDIPYLPISFFKNFSITTNTFNPEKIFEELTEARLGSPKEHRKLKINKIKPEK